MDAAQTSEKGLVIRRAVELRSALNLGVHLGLDNIPGDEFAAMLLILEAQNRMDMERSQAPRNHNCG